MNRRRVLTALPLVPSLALLALDVPSWGADKPPLTDDFISDTIREKLSGDVNVKGAKIVVDVKDGVATLTGEVSTEKQKKKAESLTKKVKGVRSVVNKIQITPP
ncbi:MAG TPA: BON domain-containing protein [Bryobacteraceae bacterium]|jgi:osmotically-inducible protein OsmY|nr:BON domain-containing protein [Bryobacteraceae bacterium]